MKLKLLFLLFALFYYNNDAKTYYESTNIPNSTPTSITTSSQDNYLDNISIQDVLSSDIDASEKIEKRIINVVTDYSSSCRTYSKIDLSMDGFAFPRSTVTIDLGLAKAIFQNIRIREPSNNEAKRKSYSTSIECDSLRTAKIEVKLPKNIEITAYLKVTKVTDSVTGFQSVNDIRNVGSISLTLKDNTLSKQFSIRTNTSVSANYEDNIVSKILYSKSEVSLNIDTKFQMLIYNKLETFFEDVELPIRQYLIEKLSEQLVFSGISVTDSCSKFINPDKSLKKLTLPFLNNNFNNLYVIPEGRLDTWNGVYLSAGPIVIDGLSSFNSTELVVEESEISSPDIDGQYYSTTPRYDDPERKTITIRIKTNDLKGKLDWSYNSKQRSFPFLLDFIKFEIVKSKSFRYTRHESSSWRSRSHDYDFYHRTSTTPNINGENRDRYLRSDEDTTYVNIYVGNIQIKSSKSNICENESEFANFVLSEYLKTVIADSLRVSLNRKLEHESLFAHCI